LPARGEVWADPRLLSRLSADVGSSLQVGKLQMKVSKVLDYRPDQGSQFVELAPTLLLRLEDVAATGLVGVGSRVRYRQLFAGDTGALSEFNSWLSPRLKADERLESLNEASPQLQSSIERAPLSESHRPTSVLLAAWRWPWRRVVRGPASRQRGLMKSMGASQNKVLSISLVELGMLGVIAGVLGTSLGYLAQMGLAYVARDLMEGVLPAPSWDPAILGMVTP
jgi:putative ABC transport system permease protein